MLKVTVYGYFFNHMSFAVFNLVIFPSSLGVGEKKGIEEEIIPPFSLECKLLKDRGSVCFIYCRVPTAYSNTWNVAEAQILDEGIAGSCKITTPNLEM